MTDERVEGALMAYLARCTPLAEESARWAEGRMRLLMTSYLADAVPPLAYTTSARCLAFQRDSVLVQRDVDSTHILPGGRREADETLEETLRRELLEETGWAIGSPILLGCVHFHHLTPRPAEYAYPYPDFVQVVYTAEAAAYLPDALVDDGNEVESAFRPVAEVRQLALAAGQRLFLEAALQITHLDTRQQDARHGRSSSAAR